MYSSVFVRAMDVEDGRHFRHAMDDAVAPAEWETKLLREISQAKKKLLEARHSKGGWFQEQGLL